MAFSITPKVTWVGIVDWELTSFHGHELSTHKGTSYNAYLVRGEKTVLIDTVWRPFADRFIDQLQQVVDPSEIDLVVANHAEIDHSGALPELMDLLGGDTPIYCTTNGVRSLKGHYHRDWNFQTVKTGDRVSLGDRELVFVEAKMLHWPDSMFCYLTGENILFPNDAFGQHFASEHMYNDLVDQCELFQECIKYYANILTPFSAQVARKIEEFTKLGLPVDLICPSHGVIWRKDPLQIVEKYAAWASDYQEDQVTLLYDTMWNATRHMAEAIAEGIKAVDQETTVKLLNGAIRDKNDIMTEVFKSKAVLVGSPTINRGILSSMAGLLEEMRGLNFKGKKAAAFGSYGWSGESVKMISQLLDKGGFEVVNDGLKLAWKPDAEGIRQCIDFGRKTAEAWAK